MKKKLEPYEITLSKAKELCPILELLYDYEYYDEPDYNKIIFMFEKILLD